MHDLETNSTSLASSFAHDADSIPNSMHPHEDEQSILLSPTKQKPFHMITFLNNMILKNWLTTSVCVMVFFGLVIAIELLTFNYSLHIKSTKIQFQGQNIIVDNQVSAAISPLISSFEVRKINTNHFNHLTM